MLRIGTLKLSSKMILAPMAGVSDLPFRMLNRRFGCELAFVEMINVRSLGYKSLKTERFLNTVPADRPLGVQLLAGEPSYLKRGLDIIKRYHYDVLDFNAACPARKVTRRGEGAALMKDLPRFSSLLRIAVAQAGKPVTVKIRAGWDRHSINARDAARAAEDAGVKAVFIHGRTRTQEYSGAVHYDVIRQVKKALSVPVIASGDVFTPELAKKMFDETGCDGILVARGAFGNPWIFREIDAFLKDGSVLARPTPEETVRVMQEHLRACVDFYGNRVAVTIYRKFFGWYTKGFRGIRPLREKANNVRTATEMMQAIEMCRHLPVDHHYYRQRTVQA